MGLSGYEGQHEFWGGFWREGPKIVAIMVGNAVGVYVPYVRTNTIQTIMGETDSQVGGRACAGDVGMRGQRRGLSMGPLTPQAKLVPDTAGVSSVGIVRTTPMPLVLVATRVWGWGRG